MDNVRQGIQRIVASSSIATVLLVSSSAMSAESAPQASDRTIQYLAIDSAENILGSNRSDPDGCFQTVPALLPEAKLINENPNFYFTELDGKNQSNGEPRFAALPAILQTKEEIPEGAKFEYKSILALLANSGNTPTGISFKLVNGSVPDGAKNGTTTDAIKFAPIQLCDDTGGEDGQYLNNHRELRSFTWTAALNLVSAGSEKCFLTEDNPLDCLFDPNSPELFDPNSPENRPPIKFWQWRAM